MYCAFCCGPPGAGSQKPRLALAACPPPARCSAPALTTANCRPQADLWQLAASADPAALPAIRMVCGEQDALLPANREFHALLQSKGIAHTFETAPGAHTWPFWDAQLKRVLDQIFP